MTELRASGRTAEVVPPPRDAIERVLTVRYATVYRMAYALAGRADVGGAVVRALMSQSLRIWHRWDADGPPPRWFEHHTILVQRRLRRRVSGDPRADTLATADGDDAPQYLAVLRALRRLPFQQREAFILHYGGRFDLRRLAQDMDCSMDAASLHLSGAINAMRALAGAAFDDAVARLASAYDALLPSSQLYLRLIRRRVRRYRWMARLRFAFWCLIVLIVLSVVAATAYIGWRLSPWGGG